MIKEKQVLQAVKTLRSLSEKHYEDLSKKKPLFDSENGNTVYFQVTLKKIPDNNKSIKMIKVNLPHRLLKDTSEVCLIAGDLDKQNHKAEIEPDVLHYKELLEKNGINNISEVMTLRQLRTEYKPYEAKQKLLAAYDVFLADNRITECLPKVLGRHFFKKRKFPIQINMKTQNLKQQVENALSTKIFYITGRGNSCTCEVACLDMNDADIVENVVSFAKTLANQLPGSWDNVMGAYLKTSLSKAIPLYISYDDFNKIELEERKEEDSVAAIDELSTFDNVQVKVFKDGTVRTIRVKEELQFETIQPEIGSESEMPVKNIKEHLQPKNEFGEHCVISDASSENDESEIPVKNIKKHLKSKSKSKMQVKNIEKHLQKSKDEFQEHYVVTDAPSKESESEMPIKNRKKHQKSKNEFQEHYVISDASSQRDNSSMSVKIEKEHKKSKSKLQKYSVIDNVSSQEEKTMESNKKSRVQRKREEPIFPGETEENEVHIPVQKKRKTEDKESNVAVKKKLKDKKRQTNPAKYSLKKSHKMEELVTILDEFKERIIEDKL